MLDLFTPDPENDPEEEAELTYRLQQAVHEFEQQPNNSRCGAEVLKYCYDHKKLDYCAPCNGERWSVLHINAYNEHDHGGYDCMCFESM